MTLGPCQGVKGNSAALEGKVKIVGRKPSKDNPAPSSARSGSASRGISFLHHLNGNFLRPHPTRHSFSAQTSECKAQPNPSPAVHGWQVGGRLAKVGCSPGGPPGVRGVRDDSGALPPQPEPEPGEHWSPHSSLLRPPPAGRASSHPPCPAALPGSGRCWLSAGKGCRVTSGVNTACYSQIPLPGSPRRQMARACPPLRTGRLRLHERVLGGALEGRAVVAEPVWQTGLCVISCFHCW